MDFQTDLNDKQYEAVSTNKPFVRVIAGAGSGKTRVLTYRIAYLIEERSVKPWSILAITFTNKVAKEMQERIIKLVPSCAAYLNIRTFHSFAAYFLRQEINVLGYPSSFTILDEEDSEKMIKDIAEENDYKRGDPIVKKTLKYISSCKLKGYYPEDIEIKHEEFEDQKKCLEFYERYESEKQRQLSLDFDDLLLYTNNILKNYPMIRAKWQNRLKHILVDEFQDTNDVQYELIKYLLTPDSELYVVGDPDQTIYTWRGANQRIMLDLNKHFDIETIALEQNYRSTQVILDSANKLIAHNKLRIPKNLFTKSEGGEPITVYGTYSSKDEANFVIKEILNLNRKGYENKDIVILYRSNYISSDFETALTQAHINYRVYGGTKFYQRMEIKDVISYFNLIINPKNDIAFERIVNVPKRGIGETSLSYLKEEAHSKSLSLYETLEQVDEKNTIIPKKVLSSLRPVILRLELAKKEIAKEEEVLSKILEDLITDIGYFSYLKDLDDGDDRLENVKKLFEDLRYFLNNNPEATFEEYLQNIALLSAQDDVTDGNFITLMTVHTAKGLEFPVVFVVRFNNSIFPNARSEFENGFEGLEEERRLAYVAMTRAKEKLYLTYETGFSYVAGGELSESRFIKESGNLGSAPSSSHFGTTIKLPSYSKPSFEDKYKNAYSNVKTINISSPKPVSNGISWSVGEILIHKNLGRGVVIEVSGDGILKVDFAEHGIKTILGNHPFVSKEK